MPYLSGQFRARRKSRGHHMSSGENNLNVINVWWRGLPELMAPSPKNTRHIIRRRPRRLSPACWPLSPGEVLSRLIWAQTVPDPAQAACPKPGPQRRETLTKRRCWCHRRRPPTRCCGDPQAAKIRNPSLQQLCARPSAWRPACAAR